MQSKPPAFRGVWSVSLQQQKKIYPQGFRTVSEGLFAAQLQPLPFVSLALYDNQGRLIVRFMKGHDGRVKQV